MVVELLYRSTWTVIREGDLHLWEAQRATQCAMANRDAAKVDPEAPGLCYRFESLGDFVGKIGGSDPLYDLAIRWEWEAWEFRVRFMRTRKGIFQCFIVPVTEADEGAVRKWASSRWKVLSQVWEPISSKNPDTSLWATHHPYRCEESNYFAPDRLRNYRSWADFATTLAHDQADRHLAFRWDWNVYGPKPSELESYRMSGWSTLDENVLSVNFLDQVEGVYHSALIEVEHSDAMPIRAWLEERWRVLEGLWSPVSE